MLKRIAVVILFTLSILGFTAPANAAPICIESSALNRAYADCPRFDNGNGEWRGKATVSRPDGSIWIKYSAWRIGRNDAIDEWLWFPPAGSDVIQTRTEKR